MNAKQASGRRIAIVSTMVYTHYDPRNTGKTSGHIRFRENVPGSNTKINKPRQITIMLPICCMLGTSPIMGIASKVVINGARPLVVEYTWLK